MSTGISGSFAISTSNPYISGLIEYSESYDVATAMSSVSVTLKLKRTNSYSGNTTPGSQSTFTVTVGTTSKTVNKASGALTIPPGGSYVTVFTQNFTNIAHNSDGSCSVNIKISGSMPDCGSAGTISISAQSKTVALTRIARLSVLTASNGTLGSAQTLTVTKQDSSYTHTITYQCGSASETICDKSSSTSVLFTPPSALAEQNLTGTSVSITLTITTFSGNTSLGSLTKTIVCTIPDGTRPFVTISVEDVNGYSTTYGNPVVGLSALQITLTETTSNGAQIKSREISVNGEKYTAVPCTSGILKTVGSQSITAAVTDSRGRTGTATRTINVLAYSTPVVTSLTVHRCNSDGTTNDKGEYVKVTFSGSVEPLNNRNHTTWKVCYKKSTDDTYTEQTVHARSTGNYSVTNETYQFAADTGESYDVYIELTDDFNTILRNTSASTAQTIMHFGTNGRTMSVGKISDSTRADLFDVGWKSKFSGGVECVELPSGTELNSLRSVNVYVCSAENCDSIQHIPTALTGTAFGLEVKGVGTTFLNGNTIYAEIEQIITVNDDVSTTYRRSRQSSGGGWSPWAESSSLKGSAICRRVAENTATQTTATANEWQDVRFSETVNVRNSDYITNTSWSNNGRVKFNKSGLVVLSGSVRANAGLAVGDLLSARFYKYEGESGSELEGVWSVAEPVAGKTISVTTPLLIVAVEAGDEIALQVRTTSAGVTILGTDSFITAIYL